MEHQPRTYYDVLEVSESASPAEIQKARVRLLKEYHTDRIPPHLTRIRAEAEERLREINEAFEVLKDPSHRAVYDAKLRSARAPSDVRTGQAAPPPVSTAATPTPTNANPPRRPPGSMRQLVIIALGLIVTLGIESARRGWHLNFYPAPRQIIDEGLCPGEGCEYGERWVARNALELYASPPSELAVPSSSLRKTATVPSGTWVKTLTGRVLARRAKAVVVTQPPGRVIVQDGISLSDGQRLSAYSYLGEGCWRVFIRARLIPLCDVRVDEQAEHEWWVSVSLPNGSTGWTQELDKFTSEGRLNTELAELIAARDSPTPERLRRIDAMLRMGASLNGSGGKYGTDPAEAAVQSNDVALLESLMRRGLHVTGAVPCLAYYAAQGTGTSRITAEMLSFLLESHMDLGCLTEPPLHAFLGFGSGLTPYPSDWAISTATTLMRHGASLDAKDRSGRTIFDVLKDAKDRPAAERVSQALMTLSEAGGPAMAVLNAFDAFLRGDFEGVTSVMSVEGLRNSNNFCSGAASNCLTQNYGSFGRNDGRSAAVKSQDSDHASVVLESSWGDAPGSRSSLLCQTYRLSRATAGWRVDFFDVPSRCD